MKEGFFDLAVGKIFEEVGLTKAEAPELWRETREILARKMADLSLTTGLSLKRLELYDEQKRSLIKDLKKMKDEKKLR